MLDMNPVIRDVWTAELRTTDRAQGKTNLRKGDNFCCLGILCELAAEAGVVSKVDTLKFEDDPESFDEYTYDGALTMLPESVLEWAGIKDPLPDADVDGERFSLSDLNDKGVPFAKIADYIDGGVDKAQTV